MLKFHYMNKKLFITTSQVIKPNDLYLDILVHPFLIQYPLVMWDYCNDSKTIIQSYCGTTSPINTSRRIWLIIG